MHRLGFDESDLQKLIEQLQIVSNLKVESVFSHLAGSDDPTLDDFSNKQITDFIRITDFITKELNYPIEKHILNTNGIARFPEAQFDMVRLGIGLYGVTADVSTQLCGRFFNILTRHRLFIVVVEDLKLTALQLSCTLSICALVTI